MNTQTGVRAVARKKAAKPKTPTWGEGKPLAAQVRGSAEWKAWLEEFAVKSRSGSVSQLIDIALGKLANDMGFREPPER